MLYLWEVGRLPMADVADVFWEQEPEVAAALSLSEEDGVARPPRPPLAESLRAFARDLAAGTAAAVETIDPILSNAAEHWRLERMAVVDRLVLRLAVFELLHRPETPARVVINEALELARTFSGDDAVRFINGLLDAIRRGLDRE